MMKKIKKTNAVRLLASIILLALLTGNIFAQGGFIVHPGTDVTLGTGTTLDITDGNLLIRDDNATAPSFLQNGTVQFTGSGDMQVEQYLTKDMWHGISSPMANEENGAYMWIYLMKWVESTYEWQDIFDPTTQPLVPGKGYFAWSKSNNDPYPATPDYVTLNGTPNYQDINPVLEVTDASIKSGWNLLGNPYPCAVSWNGNSAWNLANLDASIWVWDPVSGNYKTWNGSTNLGSLESGEIAATQAFWVHATDTTGNTPTSMTIPASQRTHSNNMFYKSGGSELSHQIKLRVQGNTLENDECIIGFMEGATLELNSAYDALYLNGNGTAPSLFSVLSANNFAMKQLPDWEKYNAVPINFKAGIPGTYTITASWTESFPEDLPIFLEDIKETYFQDLREQPEYSFASGLNDSPDRFVVHFGNPLGIEDPSSLESANIYSYDKTVYINLSLGSFSEGGCSIYNMMGEKLLSKEVTKGMNTISAPFEQGFYVVTLNNGIELKTKKVFIK